MGMVVHPILHVGTIVASVQSFESPKSFGTKPVVLTSMPIVVLVMKLDYEMKYNVDHFNYVIHYYLS
jgi:hypothetical protein